MRLFITGRIMKPTKRDIVVAYNIYDADTRRSGLYARSDVVNAVCNGANIVGMRIANDAGTNKPKVINGKYVCREDKYSYPVKRTDKLNDLGEPLVNSGVEIVINISGFGTNTKFRVVNSTGQERWINYDELCKKLDEGKIVGASRGIHGNIVVHKGCDKQCTFEGK